jgi:uncharacterized SAM-binding protein YcdF (DUF218 family)
MGFLLSKLLPLLLYPLGLAIGLQAIALAGRRRRWSPWLSGGSLALLWISARPFTARQLVWGLEERSAALTPSPLPSADAVIVLGGGLHPQLAPRTSVEVNEAGDRLLTGVRLLRAGKAPLLLLSGGTVTFRSANPAPAEAETARRLALELGVPEARLLLSDQARTTAEEALALRAIGQARGWRSVLLVTSAMHMPRSLATFQRRSGLQVVPVACDYLLPARSASGRPTAASLLIELLPEAGALQLTTQALKEHLGLLVYRLRGWS